MLNYSELPKYIIDGENDIIKNKDKFPSINNTVTRYTDVLLSFPYYGPNTFHSNLAIDYNTKKYIINSTSFIEDPMYGTKSFDMTYKVYSRINLNYHALTTKSKNDPDVINITEECMLFANSFSGSNSGHDLSIIINALNYYIKNKLTCKILVHKESLKIPRNLEFIQLFIDKSKFIFIENDKYYFINNLHIEKPEFFAILKHKHIIEDAKKLIVERFFDINDFKNKKIALIKHKGQKNVVRGGNCYYGDKFFDKLKANGWIILNPETMNIYKIAAYCMFAEKILLSGGAITYTHMIYMNDTPKIYFIGQKGYGDWIYCGLKHCYIEMSTTNLDTKINEIMAIIDSSDFKQFISI
jgi:hypothetical protein